VLVGFMGAGKSTAARAAAEALSEEAIDTDALLEAELGESIEAFFDREGEATFRVREEELVLRVLGGREAAAVSLGGGALGSERVRDALRSHVVVMLEVDPTTAWERSAGRGRPLARDRDRFERLHAERVEVYLEAADAVLSGSYGAEEIVRALPALEALAEALADGGPPLRLVWAHAASGDYPVFFARGALERGVFHPPDGRRYVIADERVAALHSLPGAWQTFTVPGGESEKTLANAEAALRAMARAGVTRDDLVVAFGGGVVGDLAGFCAAVYQRGVRVAQVPTTLVAQVDSAFGGKTGVDLPEAKNYVGAYHQPSAVVVDPGVLSTLPAAEVAAGYAEVVKTALIAGGRLWERVRAGADPLADEVILGCLRTKLAVVAADERDEGRRQVLNLGHTVGHALEAATDYARLRHGEAVALGLLCALRLADRDELRAEVAELFGSRGLPTHVEGVDADEVVALVARDKKRRGGSVPFVLVEAPGQASPGHEVDEGALRTAIAEVAGG
jgi:shikimate kinase/3-dehydroquinate synthase